MVNLYLSCQVFPRALWNAPKLCGSTETPEWLTMPLSYAINSNRVLLLCIFPPLLKHDVSSECLHGYEDIGEEEDGLCGLTSVTRCGTYTVFLRRKQGAVCSDSVNLFLHLLWFISRTDLYLCSTGLFFFSRGCRQHHQAYLLKKQAQPQRTKI